MRRVSGAEWWEGEGVGRGGESGVVGDWGRGGYRKFGRVGWWIGRGGVGWLLSGVGVGVVG